MLENQYKFTVHSHFVLPAIKAAERRGIPTTSLLQGTGVSLHALREPQMRFTIDQYNTIVRRIWKLLDDENTGLLPAALRLGAGRAMYELAMNARSVEDVFRKIVRDWRLVAPYIRSQFEVTSGHATFAFSFLGFEDEAQVCTELTLLCWHRYACWLAGRSFPLQRISFRYERPDHADEYAKLFGCQCVFGAGRQEMVFDANHLSLRVIRSWRDLPEFIRNSPGILLALPSSDDDIVLQVRRSLMSSGRYESTFPDFETIATDLDMTGPTLRRRLRAEGTSYQQIKDGIRRDMSIELLADTRRSIADIAGQVGFNDASSFSRAFKEWTGVPPAAYRSGTQESGGQGYVIDA